MKSEMKLYEQLLSILRTVFCWGPFVSPAPNATAVALQTETPEQVAARLDAHVRNAVANSHGLRDYAQACYDDFQTDKEYWELNTSIALGQQVELPVEHVAAATNITEWLRNLSLGFSRQGFRDGNTVAPDSEPWKLRKAASKLPPLEWVLAGKELIWELAVLAGYIQVGLTGFGPAYAQQTPRLSEVRGIDAQQWMENLNSLDQKPRPPLPWPPQRPASKVAA